MFLYIPEFPRCISLVIPVLIRTVWYDVFERSFVLSDIYEEIKEDVQAEKLLKFWKTHQKRISSATTAILVIIAIGYYWQYRQNEIRTEASHDYSKAMMYAQAEMDKKALESLELMAQNSDNSYTDLSKLFASGIFIAQDNLEDARAAYSTLIKESGSPVLTDLAKVKLGYLDLDMGSPKEILVSMEKLAHTNSPWRFHALEIMALAQMRLDDMDAAKSNLEKIVKDDDAPSVLKMRADLLLSRTLGNVK